MGIVAYVVVGLIAGLLAKLLMPGSRSEPAGFVGTVLLGIVGAVVGGLLWNVFLHRPGAQQVDLASIFVALVGSLVVLAVLRLVNRSRG